MLMKLEREIARLALAKERLDVIDHGLNVAMTAWHLVDWEWADIKRSRGRRVEIAAKAGIQADTLDKEAFMHFALKECAELRYCRGITNSAKHFVATSEVQKFETGAAPAEINWMNNQGQRVTFVNSKGEAVIFTTNAWDLWITDGDVPQRAADVFGSAFAWWKQLIGGEPAALMSRGEA